MKEIKVKCERCGRIADLFQYTYYDEGKTIDMVVDNGTSADPRMSVVKKEINESRGLCEECAVEVNKKNYDFKLNVPL